MLLQTPLEIIGHANIENAIQHIGENINIVIVLPHDAVIIPHDVMPNSSYCHAGPYMFNHLNYVPLCLTCQATAYHPATASPCPATSHSLLLCRTRTRILSSSFILKLMQGQDGTAAATLATIRAE